MDYRNTARGREQISLDEYDEQAYAQAYGRATSTPGASDAVPGIRPAHPVTSHRVRTRDYDRYLERSQSKFQIFTAQSRRRKTRTALGWAALALFVLATIVAIILILNQ